MKPIRHKILKMVFQKALLLGFFVFFIGMRNIPYVFSEDTQKSSGDFLEDNDSELAKALEALEDEDKADKSDHAEKTEVRALPEQATAPTNRTRPVTKAVSILLRTRTRRSGSPESHCLRAIQQFAAKAPVQFPNLTSSS